MAAVSAERTGVASGINNAVARVASLLAIAVLGIVFVWSHNTALAARLVQLHVPQEAQRAGQLLEPGADLAGSSAPSASGAQDTAPRAAQPLPASASASAASPDSPALARAQADALGAALRAVALASAACALAGAALAAATVQRRK
jgi:hypothetical protein